MTEKILRRGVRTPDSYEPDVLKTINVEKLINTNISELNHPHFVFMKDDVGWAAELMGKYNVDRLAVKENSEDDTISGIITAEDILKFYSSQKQKEHMFESPGRTRRILVQGRKLWQKTW